jgi:hypothetical protein
VDRWFGQGRARGQRERWRLERERLLHDQYTVAAALGGRLIPRRGFGRSDVPDVELRRAGLVVRTAVDYHGDAEEAALSRWIRVTAPNTMRWRVPRLNHRGRRDLPPAAHELLVRLEDQVDGVELDRADLVVWLPGLVSDPKAVRAYIDRAISVARKLLVPGG